MNKYLITGFSGFVSKHFIQYLEQQKIPSLILGLDINEPDFRIASESFKYIRCEFIKIDLLDKEKIKNIIFQFSPEYILHLASFSSVAFSWKEPLLSFQNNTNIFLNLLETIREFNLKTRVLSIGSSEEYGDISEDKLPLREETPLNPISPYAVARVSQELLSKIYVDSFGLDIILTRSFNHIGPGQKEIFVVSSFVKQLVEIKLNGLTQGELTTGDVNIIRDFLDVRDVVAAYYNLLKKGKSGEIYNVCSGNGITLEEVIQKIAILLKLKVTIKPSNSLIRPNDNKIIIGSNLKIKKELGWQAEYSIERSLIDLIDYWELQLTDKIAYECEEK